MNIVDVLIVLLLIFGATVGLKKGFTTQLVDTAGTIVVIILSFLFKGFVANFLFKFCPFFNFSGNIEGITALNIALYELIAFILVFLVLYSVLVTLKNTTKIFEKILNATIVLGIPSKILGAIVGVIQNYIFLFVILFFLSLPSFRLESVKESNLANKLLNSTPILSNICNNMLDVYDDFDKLLDKYADEEDKSKLNQDTLQLLVDRGIIDAHTANELISSGKLKGLNAIAYEEA